MLVEVGSLIIRILVSGTQVDGIEWTDPIEDQPVVGARAQLIMQFAKGSALCLYPSLLESKLKQMLIKHIVFMFLHNHQKPGRAGVAKLALNLERGLGNAC
ncbi:hypothetical protein D3C75_519350 [compost metagenome]